MNITNVYPLRVIVHEVVRASQIAERPPLLSDVLVVLDEEGKALVGRRLIDTVASGSHCVDVTVDDGSSGSPFDRATAMLDADDDVFVANSKFLATLLSTVQTAGAIKSGSAIFIEGTCLANGRDSRFLAIIKADSDQALLKRVSGEIITLTYGSSEIYRAITGERANPNTALGELIADAYRGMLKDVTPDELNSWAEAQPGLKDSLLRKRATSVFYRDSVVILLGLLVTENEADVPKYWPVDSYYLEDLYSALGISTNGLF